MPAPPTNSHDENYENNILATGAIHAALMAAQGAGCRLTSRLVMDDGIATNQIDIDTDLMLSTYRITIERVPGTERDDDDIR